MTRRVAIPEFELVGQRCEHPGCKGVLVDTVTTHPPLEWFQRCSECSREFNRAPADEKFAWAVRAIERALKRESSS
jgi:hypothetical protein